MGESFVFDVGKRIIELRESRGMNMSEFAVFTGLSQSYLSQIESGVKKNMSIEKIELVCNACEISLADFFAGVDNPINIQIAKSAKVKDDLLERINKLKSELQDIEKKIKE
jgi:transcriptional regulator with XRE-family HTH domain